MNKNLKLNILEITILHSMECYFSQTDDSTLREMSKKYDYFLSLIVNMEGKFACKIAMSPSMEKENKKLNIKSSLGKITLERTYDYIYEMECEVSIEDSPVLTETIKKLKAAEPVKTYGHTQYRDDVYSTSRASNFDTRMKEWDKKYGYQEKKGTIGESKHRTSYQNTGSHYDSKTGVMVPNESSKQPEIDFSNPFEQKRRAESFFEALMHHCFNAHTSKGTSVFPFSDLVNECQTKFQLIPENMEGQLAEKIGNYAVNFYTGREQEFIDCYDEIDKIFMSHSFCINAEESSVLDFVSDNLDQLYYAAIGTGVA